MLDRCLAEGLVGGEGFAVDASVIKADASRQRGVPAGGPASYAYSSNYLIDVKAGVIVDVETTPAYRTDEVEAARTMIDRVEERFEVKPAHLIGDTAYGTSEMLGWRVEQKRIEPHVPVWDKSERTDGTFSMSDIAWNGQEKDIAAQQVTSWALTDGSSQRCEQPSRRTTRSSIAPVRTTAETVH